MYRRVDQVLCGANTPVSESARWVAVAVACVWGLAGCGAELGGSAQMGDVSDVGEASGDVLVDADSRLECGEGAWRDGASGTCHAWTVCAAGTFELAVGTAVSDRVCVACAEGTFAAAEGGVSCAPWTACVAGESVTTEGSASSDRVCTPCPEGAYSVAVNQPECVVSEPCAPGSVEVVAPTPTSPRACEACAAGTYCAGGDAAVAACAQAPWDNAWDDDASAATACVAMTDCVPGEAVAVAGSATSDRVCAACAAGTFSAELNATSCVAHSVCSAGSSVETAPSERNDRTCSPCALDAFSDVENAEVCVEHAVCAAGTFVLAAPTATSDRVCAACAAGYYSDVENASGCVAHTVCDAGSVVGTAGTALLDNVCVGCVAGAFCAGGGAPSVACAAGLWDADGDPATPCVEAQDCGGGGYEAVAPSPTTDRTCAALRDCDVGSFISEAATPTSDRVCAACPTGTYSVGLNVPACTAQAVCAAGATVAVAGTPSSNVECRDCESGEYCPGGDAPAVACVGTWDDDADPVTACVAAQDCSAGTYVVSAASGTVDRVCAACAAEMFSDASNAAACAPWTPCDFEGLLIAPGTSTSNVECGELADWMHQFGTYSWDSAPAVAVHADGYVYVAGSVGAALPGQVSAGRTDIYVAKFDVLGRQVWLQQLGSSLTDLLSAMAIDADGNAYLAGQTAGSFMGHPHMGERDALVFKLDPDGEVLWSTQFGSADEDIANEIALGPDNALYVVGTTEGDLGADNTGGTDLLVQRLDARDGSLGWTYQVGSGDLDKLRGVAVSSSGTVYCAGGFDGAFPGETHAGLGDVVILALSSSGTLLWSDQFGTDGQDSAIEVVVTEDALYVTGWVHGTLPGATWVGWIDGFVARYSLAGERQWLTQFGSTTSDSVWGMVAVGDGVAVVGATATSFLDGTSFGFAQAFVAQFNGEGTLSTVDYHGGTASTSALVAATFGDAWVVLGGGTWGQLGEAPSAGTRDAFVWFLEL